MTGNIHISLSINTLNYLYCRRDRITDPDFVVKTEGESLRGVTRNYPHRAGRIEEHETRPHDPEHRSELSREIASLYTAVGESLSSARVRKI